VDNAKAEFTVPARSVAVFITNKKLPNTNTPVTQGPKKSKGGGAFDIMQLMDGLLCLLLVAAGVLRTRRS
jgi:hypothetical protein